jgi:hypothetical protein
MMEPHFLVRSSAVLDMDQERIGFLIVELSRFCYVGFCIELERFVRQSNCRTA